MYFLSNHPIHQKRSMIFQLIDKAILLTDTSFHSETIEFIKTIILQNSYLRTFIEKNIPKRLQPITYDIDNKKNFDPSTPIVIPYNEQFNAKISQIFKTINFKVINSIPNKFNHIIRNENDNRKMKTL